MLLYSVVRLSAQWKQSHFRRVLSHFNFSELIYVCVLACMRGWCRTSCLLAWLSEWCTALIDSVLSCRELSEGVHLTVCLCYGESTKPADGALVVSWGSLSLSFTHTFLSWRISGPDSVEEKTLSLVRWLRLMKLSHTWLNNSCSCCTATFSSCQSCSRDWLLSPDNANLADCSKIQYQCRTIKQPGSVALHVSPCYSAGHLSDARNNFQCGWTIKLHCWYEIDASRQLHNCSWIKYGVFTLNN